MRFPRLFQRGQIGPIDVPNRIVVPPTSLGYCVGIDDKWWPSERHIRTYDSWARGGVGLIIHAHMKVECQIDKEGAFSSYVVLDRDDGQRVLFLISDTVHRYGAKIVVQLSVGCGRIAALSPGHQPIGPSPNPCLFDPKVLTRELTISEIERLVEAYGEAAARLKRAEYDGIVVHCLSQLFDQFISPLWNRRTDKYGGDTEGRMRFVLECIESVRSQAGSDFAIIPGMVSDYKLLKSDVLIIPGMATAEAGVREPTIEDSVEVAKRFEKAGVHGLYVRAGGYHSPSWLVPPMYMEDGCSVDLAQPINEAVGIPVILDGKIRIPQVAERILEEGKADFIGISRPILADPEWPKKARQGRPQDIRQCIACNECILRLRDWAPLGCSVNPTLGVDWDCDVVPATWPRRVLVIGGGPGGMEAAIIAAQRGHDVTLYEKDDQLGGHLVEAGAPEFKKDIRTLLDRLITQLKTTKVKVKMSKEATLETVKQFQPDVVIVATGSIALVSQIPGINGSNAITALDVLRGRAQVGPEVVVLGGNEVGAETALYLAQMGKTVTIVRRGPEPKPPDVGSFNVAALMAMIAQNNVNWVTNVEVTEINTNGIVVVNKDTAEKQTLSADTVVLARGLVSDSRLYYQLEGNVPEILLIGDAVKPRKIWEAMHEGFYTAREI